MKLSWKWIWIYFINHISLLNLLCYRENNKEATRLLKQELELAKMYPQYVFVDSHFILLHNHIFWTENRFYMSGICYPSSKLVSYYSLDDIKQTYIRANNYDVDERPSIHMRIQLQMFIEDYLAGKYN